MKSFISRIDAPFVQNILLTFISNIDNLPGAWFFLWNNYQARLIVQYTGVICSFSPERYSIPVCDILCDLHDGPRLDCETLSRFLVAC